MSNNQTKDISNNVFVNTNEWWIELHNITKEDLVKLSKEYKYLTLSSWEKTTLVSNKWLFKDLLTEMKCLNVLCK